MTQESFDKRLVRLMSNNRLTVREASKLTGVAVSTIQNWRSGTLPGGDYDAVRKLASRLGVSMSYLLTGLDDTPHSAAPALQDVLTYSGESWEGIFEISVKRLVKPEVKKTEKS